MTRSPLMRRRPLLGLLAAACIGLPLAVGAAQETATTAQPKAPAAQDSNPQMTMRVYNVQDLLVEIPDFPATPPVLPGKVAEQTNALMSGGAMGLFGGSGAGMQAMTGGAGAAPSNRPARANAPGSTIVFPAQGASTVPGSRGDELMKLVMETVAPDTWKDAGGTVGTLRLIRGSLVVNQTPEAQNQLSMLLSALRADQSATVRIRARWVLLQPGELEEMMKRPQGKAQPTALEEVDPAALQKVTANSAHFDARTTCFNGQTVSVSSGRQHTVISSESAVVGTGVGAYDPTVGLLQSGLSLQVTPILNAQEKTVVLTIASTFTGPDHPSPQAHAGALLAAATQPSAASGQPVGLIDRIDAVVQSLRTTIRVPLNKTILVGGMTLEPEGKTADGAQLYLFIDTAASM